MQVLRCLIDSCVSQNVLEFWYVLQLHDLFFPFYIWLKWRLELVNILAGLGSDEVGGSAGGDNVGRDLFRRLPATQMPKPHGRGVVRGRHGRRYEDDMDMVLPLELLPTWRRASSSCGAGGGRGGAVLEFRCR